MERVEQLLHEARVFLPPRVFADLLATVRSELPGSGDIRPMPRRDRDAQQIAAYLRPIRRLIHHGEDGEGALAPPHIRLVVVALDELEGRGPQTVPRLPSA